MTGLEPRADQAVRLAVDAYIEGLLGKPRPGEVIFNTKNNRYRLTNGILSSAPDRTLVGAEMVGWLFEGGPSPVVDVAWQPGARAVFVDRRRGRHIVVTSVTRMCRYTEGAASGSRSIQTGSPDHRTVMHGRRLREDTDMLASSSASRADARTAALATRGPSTQSLAASPSAPGSAPSPAASTHPGAIGPSGARIASHAGLTPQGAARSPSRPAITSSRPLPYPLSPPRMHAIGAPSGEPIGRRKEPSLAARVGSPSPLPRDYATPEDDDLEPTRARIPGFLADDARPPASQPAPPTRAARTTARARGARLR